MMSITDDLRSRFGPARDQGERPTCVAFATSDAHAATRGKWLPLSCEFAYYHALKRQKISPPAGARLSVTLNVLESDGQPAEHDWPYLPQLPKDLSKWIPPAGIKQLFSRRSTIVKTGMSQIQVLLKNGKPTIVVMTISDAFYQPDKDGIVDSTEVVDNTRRHAVVAVCLAKRGKDHLVLIRNSWGHTWGINGYAWLTERYISPRLLAIANFEEAA